MDPAPVESPKWVCFSRDRTSVTYVMSIGTGVLFRHVEYDDRGYPINTSITFAPNTCLKVHDP